jgi:nitrogen fixation NifU-like protein
MNASREDGQTRAAQDDFYGRMNDPSAGAWVTGPCGDTMEFYLVIENDVIRQVKYHTDGCEFTRLCGRTVATYVQGKTLVEALSLSGKWVLDALPQLPPEHRHCAILAVSTFYKTVGQYWVEVVHS